jgi:hypothetical protein
MSVIVSKILVKYQTVGTISSPETDISYSPQPQNISLCLFISCCWLSAFSKKTLGSYKPLEMYVVGNIYVIAAVAVIGGGLFGFDISSMSAIISTNPYLCYFNQGPLYWDTDQKCSGPTASVQGGITASMPGGSWVGALLSGFLSDILGRKKSIQVGAVIWYVG